MSCQSSLIQVMPDTQMVLKVEGVIQHGAATSGFASSDNGAFLGAATPATLNLSSRHGRKRKAAPSSSSTSSSSQDRHSSSSSPSSSSSASEEKRHRNIRKVVVTVKTTLQSKAASVMEMNLKPEATTQSLSRSVIPQNDYFCQQVRISNVQFCACQC